MKTLVTVAFLFSCLVFPARGAKSTTQDCPVFCLTNGDEICGTNGQTFTNICLLRAAACQRRTSIQVRHSGPCRVAENVEEADDVFFSPGDSADDDDGELPSRPGIGEYLAAASRCPIGCHKIYSPVCGSDDQTYDNECVLRETACVSNIDVSVRSQGYCRTKQLTRDDYDRCIEFRCTRIRSPVCGTDGRTYSNRCTLNLNRCLRIISDLSLSHRGSCSDGPQQEEENVRIPDEIIDDERDAAILLHKREALQGGVFLPYPYPLDYAAGGFPRQLCPSTCSSIYRPVCGTDGVTYTSQCRLARARCEEKPGLGIASRGRCEEVLQTANVGFGDVPLLLPVVAEPESECPYFCTLEYNPVCGTDGETYANVCNLLTAKCAEAKEIDVEHQGPCRSSESDESGAVCTADFTPVCGTDGVTYSNLCNMQATANQLNLDIGLKHEGRCQPAAASGE